MPKPRKPSSAQAWAQGLGNKPNKFASGARSRDLVPSNSSGDHVRNTGPVLVMGGGPKSRGASGFQCLSLDNYTAEEIMNHVDSLDAEYAKRHPGFVSKPWTEGEVRRLKESCKPSTMSDEMYKSLDSHLEKNDEIDKGKVESKGGKFNGRNDAIQKEAPQVKEKIDNLNKGKVEPKGKMMGDRVEPNPCDFQFFKPNNSSNEVNDDPNRSHVTLVLDGRWFVMREGATNADIDDFEEMVEFDEQYEAGVNTEVEDEKMADCYDGIALDMVAMMTIPFAIAIIVYGKYYNMHEDRKDEDIVNFVLKFVKYEHSKKGDETEKCKLLQSLKRFTEEVVEPVVVVHDGVSVSLDNSKICGSSTFGVLFVEKAKEKEGSHIGGIEPKEPKEDNSNEVGEYEEVDGFDPHNIKCKCVIS